MNAPYIPGGWQSRFTRQISRFLARDEIYLDLDHAIVSISFDDFPKSAVSEGAPALEARGWTGTYYASAGYLGQTTHHGAMFDAEDLQRLELGGHEIACHTYEHLDCAKASCAEVINSLEHNERALKELGVKQTLSSFAYPYGETAPAIKSALASRFQTLRGVRPDIMRGRADRNLLPAVGIDGGDAGIQRAIEAAESLAHHPGWLVFYVHDIQAEPTEWGCTPHDFERVLAAIDRSGAQVLNVRDAYAALSGETV